MYIRDLLTLGSNKDRCIRKNLVCVKRKQSSWTTNYNIKIAFGKKRGSIKASNPIQLINLLQQI